MPPKAKKVQAQKAAKKLDDKTFGMKNKKGAKNQRFIQNEQKAAGMDKGAAARAEAKRIETRKLKLEEEKRLKRQQELLADKIRKAKELKAEKSGNVLKPVEKEEEPEDPMVVSGPSLTLTIGATPFTVEQIAKNARKNAPKKEKVKEVVISLEELVERERAALHKKGNLTPVTLETFMAWKDKVKKAKAAEAKKRVTDKKEKLRKTGREIFTQNPKIAVKDADEEEEEEVDGRIEVRDKRITEEDEGTAVFGEDGLPTVEKLTLSSQEEKSADAATKSEATPAGAE